ncbi:MAG: hypothetical protein LVQ96_06365 [Thermoplasmatales archaeon]|nr:hypothetical protein [Thermoplasmatales archaeon]
MERTNELVFTKDRVKTDLMLYKEKAELLIPKVNEENRFHALCNGNTTRFFITSTSLEDLNRMRFFFYRLYDAITEDADVDFNNFSNRFVLANLRNFRKDREEYYPRFARNLLEFSEMDEETPLLYTVIIRSARTLLLKRVRFNFLVMVSSSSRYGLSRIHGYILQEMIAMKKEAGWKMRTPRTPSLVDNLLKNPFNLVNFIRIPSEHDTIV